MARRVTPQALLHRLAIAWIVVGVASAVGCTRTAEQGGAASAPRVVTTRSTGIPHGHEGQPLVVDETMYVVTPFPNNLLEIDLTRPDGALKVVCEPHPDRRAVGIARCDVVTRSAQFADRKIVYSLLDATVVAVDANDGHEVWRTKVGDIDLDDIWKLVAYSTSRSGRTKFSR